MISHRPRPPHPAGLRHQALLYDSSAGLLAVVVPYLRAGLANGDHVVVIASPDRCAAMREALSGESDAVTFEDAAVPLADGPPGVAGYRREFERWTQEGRCVRAVTEEPWPDDDAQAIKRGHSHGGLDEGLYLPGMAIVCLYDRAALTSEAALAVRASHPLVIEEDPRAQPPATAGDPMPASPAEPAEIVCPADPAEVRSFVRDVAAVFGLADPHLSDFVLAVHEIAANSLAHAEIDAVRVWRADRDVIGEVTDYGPGVAPSPVEAHHQAPEPTVESGRGLWLAHQLADSVEVRDSAVGSAVRVRMRF